MDPLSISASVVGLLGITAKMANFLQGFISATVDAPDSMRGVLSEAESMRAIFEQLQWFLAARIQTQKDRTSMILVDHLVTALTGCVMTFDRLQCELESFFDQQNGDKSIGNRLLWDRLRWATKETTIKKHVTDLQKHKSTLSLMLTILQSHSTVEAESCLVRLCDTVEDILQSNRELAARMQHFELSQNTSNLIAISSDSAGVTHLMNPDSSETIARRSFEETLWKTSAYSHARERVPADFCSVTCRRSSLFSRISSGSGVSLSDISNISVIGIPITASDITHHSLYSSSVHSGSSPSILTTRTTSVTEVSSKDQSIDRSRSTVINISSTITTNSSSSRSPLKKQSVFPFNNDWGFYKVPQPDVNKPPQIVELAIESWKSQHWGSEDLKFHLQKVSNRGSQIWEGSIPLELGAVCVQILARRDLGIPTKVSVYKNVQKFVIKPVPYTSEDSLPIVYVLAKLNIRPLVPASQYHQWRKVLQGDVFHIPTTILEVAALFHQLPERNRKILAFLLSFLRFMTDPHTRTTIVLDFLPVLFLSTSGIINADDNESSLQRGVEFLIMHCPSIIENEKDLPPPLTEGDDEDEHDKYWKTIWPKGLFENAQASNVELWYPSPTGQITYHVDTKVAESGKDGVLLPIIFHKQISPGEGLREMGPYMWEKS